MGMEGRVAVEGPVGLEVQRGEGRVGNQRGVGMMWRVVVRVLGAMLLAMIRNISTMDMELGRVSEGFSRVQ